MLFITDRPDMQNLLKKKNSCTQHVPKQIPNYCSNLPNKDDMDNVIDCLHTTILFFEYNLNEH